MTTGCQPLSTQGPRDKGSRTLTRHYRSPGSAAHRGHTDQSWSFTPGSPPASRAQDTAWCRPLACVHTARGARSIKRPWEISQSTNRLELKHHLQFPLGSNQCKMQLTIKINVNNIPHLMPLVVGVIVRPGGRIPRLAPSSSAPFPLSLSVSSSLHTPRWSRHLKVPALSASQVRP